MNNEKEFETGLSKVSNLYFPMIQRQLEENTIEMDDYSKSCVMNAISAINNTLDTAGITWNDKQLDQSNITEILLSIATLKLNSTANPNEVYFQIRNTKFKKRNEHGKMVDEWRKVIEMGIEGDGNDAILARFGRNVKQVMQYWLVREGDEFKYPRYVGLEMSPPEWSPTGKGNVVRVVYPIIKHGDFVEYHIAERHDVLKNLIAHINNNLMNETFGFAKDRYDATAEQREKINKAKDEIMKRVEQLGLDGTLNNEELQKHISPAWKDRQSRESMIIRKMRNNIVKKAPKDFGNTLAEVGFDNVSNEYHRKKVQEEVVEHANTEMLDFQEPQDESIQVQMQDESVQVVEEVVETSVQNGTVETGNSIPKQKGQVHVSEAHDEFSMEEDVPPF